MSTVPTGRMVTDADAQFIAELVVKYMREPAVRWRCQCGECHNCLSRVLMRKSRARRKKVAARQKAKPSPDER